MDVIEAVLPENHGYRYAAVLTGDGGGLATTVLAEGRFQGTPFINFRWSRRRARGMDMLAAFFGLLTVWSLAADLAGAVMALGVMA